MSGFARNTFAKYNPRETLMKQLHSLINYVCLLMRSHCSMPWLEFRIPHLPPSIPSHFPQLSWIRRLIYPGTCARGFISCSVSVLINVRGLLTCLTPNGTLCLLWQNGKVESVTCFDTGVTGLLGACLCVCYCVTMVALHMFMQLKGRSTQTVRFLMHSCLRNRSYNESIFLSTHILTEVARLHSQRLLEDTLRP